jgi:hypothetical protein
MKFEIKDNESAIIFRENGMAEGQFPDRSNPTEINTASRAGAMVMMAINNKELHAAMEKHYEMILQRTREKHGITHG